MLTTILRSKKGAPTLAAARLQCWALLLSAYDYKMQFKATQSHSNADGLSRLPLPIPDSETTISSVSVVNIAQIQSLPVTFQQVKPCDPILTKVSTYITTGWPEKVPENLKPYQHQHEIGIESGCLMWGPKSSYHEVCNQRL